MRQTEEVQAGSLDRGAALSLDPQPLALGQCTGSEDSGCNLDVHEDHPGWNPELRQEEEEESQGFRAFPVEVLPLPVREFVVAYAHALDCDESQLALPVLSVLASAVGNAHCLRLSDTWTEPAIVWTAIVADSGTRKTPPIYAATAPLWDAQTWELKHYPERWAEYQEELDLYYQKLHVAVALDRPRPARPNPPFEGRCIANEVAVEPLALLLNRSPRGLLVCRDELDGWLGSFDRGRGSGPAHWLELHGGRPMLIDRPFGKPRTINVPYASVSVTGGIQPELLAARLTKSHLSSGLFARLLFAFPPARARRWSQKEVDPGTTKNYAKAVQTLMLYPFCGPTKDDDPAPRPIHLSAEARQRFVQFVEQFGQEQADADPDLTATFSKLEGYAARLALVLHMTRSAVGEPVDHFLCDLQSMEAGITLSRWFAHEAKRVRALIRESPAETDQRKLIGWLQRRGGQPTARDLARSNPRRYSNVDAARTRLDALADTGIGAWVDRESDTSGGRPNRSFVLSGGLCTKRGSDRGHGLENRATEDRQSVLGTVSDTGGFVGRRCADSSRTEGDE